MTQVETITTGEAIDLCEKMGGGCKSRPTIIAWVDRYNLGQKTGGRYNIDKIKYIRFLTIGSKKFEKEQKQNE